MNDNAKEISFPFTKSTEFCLIAFSNNFPYSSGLVVSYARADKSFSDLARF